MNSVQKCHKTYSWLEYGGRDIIPAPSKTSFIRRGFLSLTWLFFHFDVILKNIYSKLIEIFHLFENHNEQIF